MRILTRRTALTCSSMLTAGMLAACGSDGETMETNGIAEEVTQKVREELVEPEPEFDGDPLTESRTIEAGGLKRDFIVTVPPGIEERVDVPLIFAFHGYKNDAHLMRKLTRFDESNAVVAYMDGVGEAWAPAPYAETTGDQDLEFFDAVRQQLIDEYPINPAKVFVAGMSNGGGFAAYAACHRPHQITGIATVSAAFYDKVFDDCAPIPVKQIDFHGTSDGTMDYDGGVRHNEAYMATMDVMENASRRNHCDPDPVPVQIRRPGEEFVWEGCDAALHHYRIDGGGHVWPGSQQDSGSATQPEDGYSSETILDFFGITYRGPMGPSPQ